MARRRRLFLAAGLLAALAALAFVGSPQKTRYVPETLFSASYGEGARQVGLLDAPGAVTYGPQGFLPLPGGRVVVLDTWNHRLLEADRRGAWHILPLPGAPLVRGEHLALSRTGAYLIADNHSGQVMVMGRDGEGAVIYPDSGTPATDLRIVRGMVQSGPDLYLSILEATPQRIDNLLLRISPAGRLPLEKRLPPRSVVAGMASAGGGKLLLLLSVPGHRQELASLSPGGKATILWRVPAGTSLLGADRSGTVFLLAKGQVQMYNASGHPQGGFAVPAGGRIRISQVGSVSESGIVYLAEAGVRNYRIVAYHPHRYREWWPF